MAKQPEKSMVGIDLTEAQKKRIRLATGREVKRLELRLQNLPESPAGQEGAAEPEIAVRPDQGPALEERKRK
jgi:hypothetical protein